MADVRWRAFVPALILAPLVPAALAALVFFLAGQTDTNALSPLFILSSAIISGVTFGAPTYLTFGSVAFWRVARRGRRGIGAFASAGFVANLVSSPAVLAFFLVTSADEALGLTAMLIGFGCLYAPVWGGLFGLLYRRFGGMA